jgi:hypothetical protein
MRFCRHRTQDHTHERTAQFIRTRRRLATEESPTLAAYPATKLADAYVHGVHGREDAEAETGLLDLPSDCPWTIEQVLDRAFWPGLPWEADEP